MMPAKTESIDVHASLSQCISVVPPLPMYHLVSARNRGAMWQIIIFSVQKLTKQASAKRMK